MSEDEGVIDIKDIVTKDHSLSPHRKSLGIPRELDDRPVLSISSHRGALSTRYPSHIENLQRTLAGDKTFDDREYTYLDLTTATEDEIIRSLREIIVREESSGKGTLLTSVTSHGDPLPGFIANVQYLPALDNTGIPTERPHLFAIEPKNARKDLKRVRDFLYEKGILKDNEDNKKLG